MFILFLDEIPSYSDINLSALRGNLSLAYSGYSAVRVEAMFAF
jgi:hypothetical protein